MKPDMIIIGGPTASGKSDIALKLAKEFDGEIISADSMQIYKRLDIGTAKPTENEQAEVRHHLINIAEPYENYSVSDFVKDAKKTADDIISRGKLPVVCGGTGLYIEALIHPTNYEEDASFDLDLRANLLKKDEQSLWDELNKIDPDSAKKIHKNNKKRVVRALEVYYKTGITKTELDKKQKTDTPEYSILLFLTGFYDREKLYERINKRVDIMMAQGLLYETETLLKNGDLRPGTTAYQAIGYKELFPYINGEAPLSDCVEKLKQATRNYAKRQITWFSSYSDVGKKVFSYEDAEKAANEFLRR